MKMITLFNEAKLTVNDRHKHEEYKKRAAAAKAALKEHHWKKTGKITHYSSVSGKPAGETHVYRHSYRIDHEIHLDPKTGSFEHKIHREPGHDMAAHLQSHHQWD